MTPTDSIILRACVRGLFFFINAFAIYLLLRGHNLPGGGFIAGVASAISLLMLELAVGSGGIHRILRGDPLRLAAWGLVLALLSAEPGMIFGRGFFEHFHAYVSVPALGRLHLSTVLVFDAGVYLVVVGVVTKIVLVFSDSAMGLPALAGKDCQRYASPVEEPVEDSVQREENHAA